MKRFKRRSTLVFMGEKNAQELSSLLPMRSLKARLLDVAFGPSRRIGNGFLQIRAIVEKGVVPATWCELRLVGIRGGVHSGISARCAVGPRGIRNTRRAR